MLVDKGGSHVPKGATRTKTLQVGDRAPDFTLRSHLDRPVSLKELRGKNVFIAFYPLDWTPV
jgi:peroxiredoxin